MQKVLLELLPLQIGPLPMIMQDSQPQVVSRTEQAAISEIHYNDGEDANNPLERALAPTIKKTKRNHTVGRRVQLSRRNAQDIAALRAVIDASIKQHHKSVSQEKGLNS